MATRVGNWTVFEDDAPGTATVTTASRTSTSGNFIVVFVKWEDTGTTLHSTTPISDSRSNGGWVKLAEVNYGGTGEPRGAMFYCPNITGGSSHTISIQFSNTSAGYVQIFAEEWSGLATSSPADQSVQTNTGIGTQPYATSAITTTEAGVVFFGISEYNALSAISGTAGDPDFTISLTATSSFFAYYISGSAQTITPGATATGNSTWVAIAQAFKDASGVTNTDRSPGVGSSVYGGLAPLVNPQFASPSADASDGNWTPSTGTDLYAVIDETLRSDTDYAQSGTNPSGDAMIVKLATINDPDTDAGLHLQWAAGAIGQTGQVVGSIRQGNSPGTEIAAWTHTNLPVGSYQEFDDALTSTQVGNITDWSDLYLKIVAS
jgi:hypothetical protein